MSTDNNNSNNMTIESRLAKLKQLQKRKAQSTRANRQELFKEHKKTQQSELSKHDSLLEPASDTPGDDNSKELAQRLKNLDYTLEESEAWDHKQELKEANREATTSQNYNGLAELTYRKEIAEFPKIPKAGFHSKKPSSKKLIFSQHDSEPEEGEAEDFTNKPSKAAIDALVSSLRGNDTRKYRSRLERRERQDKESEGQVGGSTREKDFNKKLERYHGQFKGND